MNSELKLLAETTDKLFGEWNDLADAWRTLEETGLTRIGISEDLGGSGGDAEQAAAVLRSAAYHSVAAPIAETLWLAGPLLAAARLPIPDGPLTAATADLRELHCRPTDDGRGWELDGTVRRVPWARGATRVVLVIGDRICSLDPQVCTIRPGANLAGEPRDDLRFEAVRVDADDVVTLPAPVDLRSRAALARTVQIGGAAQRALDHSLRYSGERVQFGRPIGAFQAVQQYLAQIAGEVVIAELSAHSAVRAVASAGDASPAVAAARVNACRAAGVVAELAHQIHGAIGTTQEHALRLSTLRLWSWREEYGNETVWARRLGERAAALDDPWHLVTSMHTV